MEKLQSASPTIDPGVAVGFVDTLWRYPVKSMLGERRNELFIDERGVLGDRAWALRELVTGRIASAKRFPRLLECRARYDIEPTPTEHGRAIVELPDGQRFDADDPQLSDRLTSLLGRTVRVERDPRSYEVTGIDRSTVFADVPLSTMMPDWSPETMPDYFELKNGSFFEIGAVYLLSSGSAHRLRELRGETAKIDQRRFRPNIYIDSLGSEPGFVEDGWIGHRLELGEALVCSDLKPTVWCVTSTLAQENLPRDSSILRTIANHRGGCLGVYASIASPELLHVGDRVTLRKQPAGA
jgi:uncharacterized protein YcbX